MLSAFATIADNWADWGPRLLEAAVTTLVITALGFVTAFAVGLILTLLRAQPYPGAAAVVAAYVWALRGVPLLVVLYLLYFALPGLGLRISSFTAGVLGLGLVYGAYLAEIFRAGLQSLQAGQREAAMALGLSRLLAFRLVVFPQVVRVVLPPLLVSSISLLKDSSVCALIAVNELTLASRAIMSESFLPLHVFALAGLFYFAIGWPASLAVRVIENRLRLGGRRTAGAIASKEA